MKHFKHREAVENNIITMYLPSRLTEVIILPHVLQVSLPFKR
jgi:hypothetical protein